MISSPMSLRLRPKAIKSIKFGIMSPEIVRKISVMEVKTAEVYDSAKLPVTGGLMDPRLGVIEPGAICKTCGKPSKQCPGHFGHIELAHPVYHVNYAEDIHNIARMTCENCSRPLLTNSEKEEFRETIREAKWDKRMYNRVLRSIVQRGVVRRRDLYVVYEMGYSLWKMKDYDKELIHYRLSLVTKEDLEGLKEVLRGAPSLRPIIDNTKDEYLAGLLKVFEAMGIDDVDVVVEFIEFVIKASDVYSKLENLSNYFINNNKKVDRFEVFEGRISIPGVDPIEAKTVYDEEIKLIERFMSVLKRLADASKDNMFKEILLNQYEEVKQIIEEIGGPERAYNSGIFVDNFGELHVPSSIAKSMRYYSKIEPARCPHCGKPLSLDIELEKPYKYFRWDISRTLPNVTLEIVEESEEPLTARTLVEKLISKMKREQTYERHRILPDAMRRVFERIPDDELFLYDLDPEVSRPEWMIITVLPVPPVTVRPSIILESGERSEDDLTHALVQIITANNKLLDNKIQGSPQIVIEDLWDVLQFHVATYINNKLPGVPEVRHRGGKHLKSITERLSGKEGRFRGNLAGKRVNFSARTVISPDPSLSINEVGVPYEVAMELTVPVVVTEYNIEELRKLVRNGPKRYPGANAVIEVKPDGRMIPRRLTPANAPRVAELLKPGWIVERHLLDGDIVLFNRQPSLHRMSIMGHVVRVLPYKTFRLNLPVCPPYNADFDGDEMNLHVLQSEEARAEAEILMKVQEHILSPRFGGPIIGGIHDHISGLFLLTYGDKLFDKDTVSRLLAAIKYEGPLPPPDKVVDGKEYWTGKTIFSLLLPKDLTLTFESRLSRSAIGGEDMERAKQESIVKITNGKLVQGAIDEEGIGAFKGKIIDAIVRKHGVKAAREFIDKISALGIAVNTIYGLTMGLHDVDIPRDLKMMIREIIEETKREIDVLIEKYKQGQIESEPGKTPEETLEQRIMEKLSEATRKSVRDTILRYFGLKSSVVLMAVSGARAKDLDLIMTVGTIGQQTIRGSRIKRGFQGRTTSHFKRGDLRPEPHGFVMSSYKDGLNPIEYFFHSAGGREGLVDTAVRTSRSGYMQRRLVNALDSVYVAYDGTVRDSEGRIIQFIYGEDGVDPTRSAGGKTVDIKRIVEEVKARHSEGKR